MNVGAVERKIARVENFCVRIKYLDGTDVRSDRDQMPTYPYENAARDASGCTPLETVRDSYTS